MMDDADLWSDEINAFVDHAFETVVRNPPFYGEVAAFRYAIKLAIEQTRKSQTDALHEQLLQECLVKLRDVQGTEAPKDYACNLIKRVERVLQGQING